MAEFASSQEIERALGCLLKLQEDPETLEGFFNKYPEANPFGSWPFLREPTEAFLRFFEITMPAAETDGIQRNINPKINELVEEFDREFAAAKEQRVNAATASKKFVEALKENAKKSNGPLPEMRAPVPPEREGAPVSPERIQGAISAAIRYPGPPEEKALVFHALASFASEQPDREIKELVPRAVEATEAAKVLSSPAGTFPPPQSFSILASNDFQKSVASVLDAVVPLAAKEAVVNKILLQPLTTIVNHPEALPQTVMGTMTDRWGADFVNSSWFTALQTDANRMMSDQKSALKVTSKFTALVSDVATTVFRGPATERVITYIETYRLVASQGVVVGNIPCYSPVVLGYGRRLVWTGANYAIRAGIKAGVKKAAVSGVTKLGLEAATGAATGGVGALIMIGADLLKGAVNKAVSVFKSLLFMGNSKNPEDNLILVVGAGVVLVFFLPIFPLLNLPAFNQSMIDTSIATSAEGGMEGGPVVNCQLTPDNPQCKFTACSGDCRWPASGYISQGPRTAAHCTARTSHAAGSAANGIDIASFSGGPVYTPRAGTVIEAYGGCSNNSGRPGNTCGGSPAYAGYGNHVILKTDDGYTLIFGHLESAIAVRAGQHVDAHAQLGWMDQTGNSTGTHLHFGVLSGGNVLDFVPTGNPKLSPEAINGCVSNVSGCTKACPATAITTGRK